MVSEQSINRLYCKAVGHRGDYCVAVCDGKLILAVPNDNDLTQLWYKDSYKDGFMLVNKSTGKVVQYFGVGEQLELVSKPSTMERSVMWTETDVFIGYVTLTTLTSVDVIMNAVGDTVCDGTIVSIILPDCSTDNMKWQFVPYSPPPQKIFCKKLGGQGDCCVGVDRNKLVLARPDDDDITQLWYKDSYEDGFMLVNKASGKVVQYFGVGVQLELVKKPSCFDRSLMWTEGDILLEGFLTFRTLVNEKLVMNAVDDPIWGMVVSIGSYNNIISDDQLWRFAPYSFPTHKLLCKQRGPRGDYCVGIKDNKLVLTLPNDQDSTQLWYKDIYNVGFMLVHKFTGKCVKYFDIGVQLELANKPSCLEPSLLWRTSEDVVNEYTMIRTLRNDDLVMEAMNLIHEGTIVSMCAKKCTENEYWKLN